MVLILERPETPLFFIHKLYSGWVAEAFLLLLDAENRRGSQKLVVVTYRLLCVRSSIKSLQGSASIYTYIFDFDTEDLKQSM